ncbi:putative FAD-binding subunit of oxidoreductase [Gottschalkia acidurici 9a]|uniref:FAD-binding subunit of oxidoreductase n=1 Tax=Gottschalkia acidurici (strain ATCC 7906 / DSM 604 / BCRC 14475 / CIP 104303 / KCTC 5404 / NCIMB 10678 / 9a) TaxID=1128398 RepID=K0AZG0_GOTA9|nr:FAD binding domain-containing protein [Gottschalkia acidurici]AFS78095.1 putative FAD-binding subunit of oxidoreductase [Gottschalkia acidurici 9a]
MITFGDYIKPKSIEEAYEIISTKKPARVMGGGMYMKMGTRRIGLLVDLCDAGLSYINETEDSVEIGAMTTFREMETSEILNRCFDEHIQDSIRDVIGVQFRNIVTIGGTVYIKHGFSDLILPLLALDARVVFFNGGEISLEDYLKEEGMRRDILEKIIIPKREVKASYQSLRISKGDYAVLLVSALKDKDGYRITVGARPQKAALAYDAMKLLNESGATEENIIRAGEIASEELTFGTNTRGSKEYRKEICKVLVKRALKEVESC